MGCIEEFNILDYHAKEDVVRYLNNEGQSVYFGLLYDFSGVIFRINLFTKKLCIHHNGLGRRVSTIVVPCFLALHLSFHPSSSDDRSSRDR